MWCNSRQFEAPASFRTSFLHLRHRDSSTAHRTPPPLRISYTSHDPLKPTRSSHSCNECARGPPPVVMCNVQELDTILSVPGCLAHPRPKFVGERKPAVPWARPGLFGKFLRGKFPFGKFLVVHDRNDLLGGKRNRSRMFRLYDALYVSSEW